MELYVIRHGETTFNVARRYTGVTDVPLTENGVDEAQSAAEKLRDIPFDIIVSSPLIRAKQTAAIIAAYHPNTPTVVMAEFAERNCGVYEGLTKEEVQQKYPELWAAKCTTLVDGAPYGGETMREFDSRIADGLLKLCERYGGMTVLLATHACTARFINKQLCGLDYTTLFDFSLSNCEYVRYEL